MSVVARSVAPGAVSVPEVIGTAPPGACWAKPTPLAAAAAYMVIIVSSQINKIGSSILGNTPHLVVVQTNSGYAPDPGHGPPSC